MGRFESINYTFNSPGNCLSCIQSICIRVDCILIFLFISYFLCISKIMFDGNLLALVVDDKGRLKTEKEALGNVNLTLLRSRGKR